MFVNSCKVGTKKLRDLLGLGGPQFLYNLDRGGTTLQRIACRRGSVHSKSPGLRGIEVTTIYVIDDDEQARKSVSVFVESIGHLAVSFSSADELLKVHSGLGEHSDEGSCIVTESLMPGMDIHDFLNEMSQRPNPVPVIVLTSNATTASVVQLIKSGAFTLLEKPFHDDELREAISEAISQSESQRIESEKHRQVMERAALLSDKERAVMELMLQGLANKVIASRLDVSVRTVESRRSAVLDKMGFGSLAGLIRAIAEAGQ